MFVKHFFQKKIIFFSKVARKRKICTISRIAYIFPAAIRKLHQIVRLRQIK